MLYNLQIKAFVL